MSKPIVIERAVPTNKSLYSSVKSRIKKKFKVWPSAYASAALVKAYKAAGGGYRNESVTIENPVYRLEGYTTNEELLNKIEEEFQRFREDFIQKLENYDDGTT